MTVFPERLPLPFGAYPYLNVAIRNHDPAGMDRCCVTFAIAFLFLFLKVFNVMHVSTKTMLRGMSLL